MMIPQSNPTFSSDDDKYTKFDRSHKKTSGSFTKYQEVFEVLRPVLIKNSNFLFGCMYVLFAVAYVHLGGHPGRPLSENVLNLVSISIEIFGLLVLRHKIQSRKSVSGISGMTMLMYAACYTVRIWIYLPEFGHINNLMEVELESSVPGILSFLLVLDCLRSIFVTHRSSYQADLDVLHVKYLLPGCFFLAFLLRAQFLNWTTFYSYMWSSCLYMDVLALMPQVVMMARGGGKVEAPIAHFVAATFLSRIEDLSISLVFQMPAAHDDELFSLCLIIFFQALHLLLVADFIYYYVKASTSKTLTQAEIEV
jgi:hypothetical protein